MLLVLCGCIMRSAQLVQGAAQRAASVGRTMHLLQRVLQALHQRAGWPYQRMHLLGYAQVCVVPLGVHHDSHAAQGATAALHLAMQQSAKGMALGSCVAVCGTLLPSDCAPPSAKGVSMDTRRPTDVLLVHGRLDEATPPAEVDRAERVLLSSGMQVTRVALSRGAGMLRGQGEMRSVMEFWGRCMLAAPPPGAQDVTDNS